MYRDVRTGLYIRTMGLNRSQSVPRVPCQGKRKDTSSTASVVIVVIMLLHRASHLTLRSIIVKQTDQL